MRGITSRGGWRFGLIIGIIAGAGIGFQYGKRWQLTHTPGSRYETSVESVDHWYDGDTVTLANSEKIRLWGIDTPELKPRPGTPVSKIRGKYPQPGALEALAFVKSNWPKGTKLTVKRRGPDKYGRTLAELIGPDGVNINDALLKKHLAREFMRK